MQKITVRTLLRALAMSPAIALGWGWARGRAKAEPATPADPLTVDASGVTVKGQLNADKVMLPGVKLEGTGGRNFFLDEESKKSNVNLGAGLRVGGVWNTNGIYSENGPVVVGSANNIIMLKGGVSVQDGTTAPTGIPEGTIVAKKVQVNGPVRVMDGGTQTYNGGVATEVNAQLINFGMNEDSGNRFGGTYTSSVQGGMFRVDTRSGQPLFTWLGREANSTNPSQLMAIKSSGEVGIGTTDPKNKLDVNGAVQAKSISFGAENLRIIRGIILKRTEIYGRGFSLGPKTAEGLHRINFDPAFTSDPTVTVSPMKGNTWASCYQMEKDFCMIKTGPGGQGTDQDFGFSFIVIGPA